MTILFSVIAGIDFLVIVLGVPYAVWENAPKASRGPLWWAVVTLLVVIFGLVSLVAGLALATSDSNAGRFALMFAFLFIVFAFFKRRAARHV